jgi:hypothetical protein
MGETDMTEPVNVPPTWQMPMPAPPKPLGLAGASLVLGIVACALCLNVLFIPSILAIIFGSIALHRVRAGTGGGKRMAKAGLICGIVSFVLTFALCLLWIMVTHGPIAQSVGPN